MARSRRNLNDSRPQSPIDDSSDEQEARSSQHKEHKGEQQQEVTRGRTGKQTKSEPAMDTAA